MNKKIHEIHADICKTLGNAKRIEILNALDNRELSVSELVDILDISPSNISQHLAIMRQKGILTARREGVNIYYKISNPKVSKACALMREVLLEQLEDGRKIAMKYLHVK
ncbi:MAG TPA: ArsR family transcriptional regulator [Nitrospirae bacterium]|nr:putative HTH-type transcriptional regulator/MT0088 [bacterium BMS3Abin06]HDH10745.1 ArsR family transcriptional regulator [Nitrospirota bacterium]HDZ03033.1 ArsR family transcriptional regulator [Nitrospirota bacterium]